MTAHRHIGEQATRQGSRRGGPLTRNRPEPEVYNLRCLIGLWL